MVAPNFEIIRKAIQPFALRTSSSSCLPRAAQKEGVSGACHRVSVAPEREWLNCLSDDFKVWRHHRRHRGSLNHFGIDGAIWTVAARRGRGALWHNGMNKGAEMFMSSWHVKEQRAAETRAAERDRVGSSTPTRTSLPVYQTQNPFLNFRFFKKCL